MPLLPPARVLVLRLERHPVLRPRWASRSARLTRSSVALRATPPAASTNVARIVASPRAEAAFAADAAWRAQVKQDRPLLGRLAVAITAKLNRGPEPQHVTAWNKGADGE